MYVAYSARSHVGRVRANNEDNLFADGVFLAPETNNQPFTIDGNSFTPIILAICDGMGGEENGEIASLIAVKKLSKSSDKLKSCSLHQINEVVQSYVNDVNIEIRSEIGNMGKRVGTTLALAVVTKNGVRCFNIGDTRIYCLSKSIFTQITNDHTLVAERLRNGSITAEQANFDKGNHKLTKCIGIGDSCIVESYSEIYGKCRLLICSDGLTDMVAQAEIEKTLKEITSTTDTTKALIDLALEKGGRDNITVIVADIPAPTTIVKSIANKLRKWRR